VRFVETAVAGAYVVELEPRDDERGFFARIFCEREFEGLGLATPMVQANLSYNVRKGTVRGLHYRREPAPEAKFFRCIAGATHNVCADVRPDSETYRRYAAVELSAANRRALYVPGGCAAGYQALTDGAEIIYMTSVFYEPGFEYGVRYDDPAIGIEWPLAVTDVSERDATWPLLDVSRE
jgi:dTDP-4-dehydrorhamnose 3,5-epimerase